MKIDKPDIIIVGSGAGGGTAARALAERGWKVLVLERGERQTAENFLPYDELHFQDHKALRPSQVTEPLIYVGPSNKPKDVERWWIANMVGGSTMVWEANLPRYTDEDFKILSVMKDPPKDTSMVDWPWTYDEFQPYFEKAEWEWGVSGKTNQCAAQEPTRPIYEYPMPPIRPHASTPFLMDAFGKAGMHPYASPRGINSRTYAGRPGCPFCGYCQGYGCAVNDRASSTNTVLAKALHSGKVELRTGHCVVRIGHEKGKVTGVYYKTEPAGEVKFIAAPRVVVSIQAIESARLFLVSEIPDPNKMIGKYLTYHTKGTAELTFKNKPVWDEGPDRKYQPRTSLGSLQLRDLYVIKDKDTYLTKGGKFSIYDPFTIYPVLRLVWGTKLWGKALRSRLLQFRNQGGVSFSFTGETMSVESNRVELHKERKDPWGMPLPVVYYRHHKYDIDLSEYALNKVVQIMTANGGEVVKWEPQGEENTGYGHNHGTLRAGKDPTSSVLDPDCQSHTVKGLYVLDAAWMPTAGASNPGLTTIANAYRVCERMP